MPGKIHVNPWQKVLYTLYQGETNLLAFYVVLVDFELEREGAAPGSTSQPVRRNISLKLKAKSKSASSLSSGKSKKKEGKSGEKCRTGSEGKEANFLAVMLFPYKRYSPRCINGMACCVKFVERHTLLSISVNMSLRLWISFGYYEHDPWLLS